MWAESLLEGKREKCVCVFLKVLGACWSLFVKCGK